MQTKSFSLRARLLSFRFAANGLKRFFREEHNAWIHLAATLFVFVLARFFSVSTYECIALILSIGIVWVAEVFNTAIEKIMDRLSPGHHPAVGYIKDLAAGAVLLAAIIATITGAIVFIPKIF